MKNLALVLLFSLLLSPVQAKDAYYLIQEMEALRDSLKIDDPARISLTLRLADLYFDVSIKEGKKEDHETLKKNRLKALKLYEHSLSGTEGAKKLKGLPRLKVQFQMARLLSRLEERKRAEPLFLEIFKDKLTPNKMREQSALALAEWFEEEANYVKSLRYYNASLELCKAKTICNYAHYRKAWLLYKDTKLDLAIEEMKLSLWDTPELIRENSLTDLMMFMSNADTDGVKEFDYLEEIAQKVNRPEITQQIIESFYVAGNRRAGSNLLAKVNERDPKLYFEVRLLEEFYGFRKWEKVEKYLADLKKRNQKDIPTKKTHKEEVLKLLRRFIVQVDSETQVIEELNTFLKQSIDIYLTLYPNDELRKKMQQGWLKATPDKKKRIKRLGVWIKEDLGFKVDGKEIRKLRQTRLSLAQKEKQSDVVIEESLALADLLKGSDEAPQFQYVAARQYYENKDYKKALPLFNEIVSDSVKNQKFHKWSVLSQNLVIDIHNHQKDFDSIIGAIAVWNKATANEENKDILKERKFMSKVLLQAEFERASSLGEKPEALEKFFQFCFEKTFEKKSCSNAFVLAVKLKDQDKVVKLLERKKDEKALVVEYERMGLFSKAAKLQEKFVLRKKPEFQDYLKVALLYELDQNLKDRDRILKKLIKKTKRDKKIDSQFEKVFLLTLREANLFNASTFFLPWSTPIKLSLASELQSLKPNKAATKLLLKQKKSQGPAWSKLILSKLEKKFKRVGRINFYGRRSKRLFKRRTKAIEKFAKDSKPYLDGSDLETRIYILHMLKTLYGDFKTAILETPLPKDLEESVLAQVKEQLNSLSAPFAKVEADYDKLLTEQMALLDKDAERVTANLASTPKSYSNLIVIEAKEKLEKDVDLTPTKKLLSQLAQKPDNLDLLKGLYDFHQNEGMGRMAAYYKGRMESLGGKTE